MSSDKDKSKVGEFTQSKPLFLEHTRIPTHNNDDESDNQQQQKQSTKEEKNVEI